MKTWTNDGYCLKLLQHSGVALHASSAWVVARHQHEPDPAQPFQRPLGLMLSSSAVPVLTTRRSRSSTAVNTMGVFGGSM